MTLILINGEEEFLKQREARRIANSFLSYEILEFTFPGDNERYDSQLGSLDLFPKNYSYILWNVEKIPVLPQNSSIVIVSAGKNLKSEAAKLVLNFPKLKSNDVVDWIIEEGTSRKIDLERVAGALFVNHGTCLRKIASEIEKLSIISELSSPVISPEEARSIMCVSAEISPSLIVDSISNGKSANVISILSKLQSNLSYTISYIFKHLISVFESEIFNAPVNSRVSHLMKKWKKSSLQNSLKTLSDLDIALRRGDPSVSFRLEFELLKLSEEINGNASARN
jgi:DNA polymerase III delta subunit